jgi:tetratricopeptide (TPR) repeat protein
MEAGWLLALIVEPLFFNVYSDRVFEPDKIAVLRSIALVLIAAWMVKLLESGGQVVSEEEDPAPRGSLWDSIRQTPLALPTLLLVVVYLVATVTSVVPRLSLWGSYQRLQGTYSFLSYIVIFTVVLGTLRRRKQLERLILIAILVSLPISLYGVMQHYELDPLPWGGNVTRRVASNMGNSIFVAAYLIMVIPLTLRNLLERLIHVLEDQPWEVQGAFAVGYVLALGIQVVAWAVIGFTPGLLVGLVFIFLTGLFSLSIQKPLIEFFWIGVYSVILAAQLVCIFFTQSRGPVLGLLGGLFFFALALTFTQRIRWLQWSFIGLALAGVVFLGLLNLGVPFMEPLLEQPYIGRYGTIFELESGTGKVRALIWEGAVELMLPHEPIGMPGQKDVLNFLRPLIGYGPESMIVAYNPFYPPELAHYERRNASPDRAHNETFDALVTTGLVGFVVYFGLFVSLFYHCLKWLNLVPNARYRNIFLGLSFGSALLSSIIFVVADGNLRLVGVALPFGFIVGVGLYLVLSSFLVPPKTERLSGRKLLLITLLSAVVAHFVEIHFGIAIAATRTYFWTYAGILVVAGMEWLPLGALQSEVPSPDSTPRRSSSSRRRRSRRKGRRGEARPAGAWPWASVLGFSLLVGMVFMTLGYSFVTNQQGLQSAVGIMINSLTVLSRNGQATQSLAMLWLFLFTWLIGALLCAMQVPSRRQDVEEEGSDPRQLEDYLLALGIYAGITFLMFLAFTLSHAARLEPGADVAELITPYYWAVFLTLLGTALVLVRERRLPIVWWNPTKRWIQALMIPALTALCIVLIYTLNISVIKADVYYKQGKHYDSNRVYDAAIRLYQEAISYAKDQDFYYLFLGRAYLQKASSFADPNQRAPWLAKAEATLEEARGLNPLNTDHSANLARLYRTRAEMTQDPDARKQALLIALDYYRDATTLSPHTAKLYNEWGLVYAMLGQEGEALEKFETSLALDNRYEETYLYLGNFYLNQQRFDEAAKAYQKAIELEPEQVQAHSALGYIYSKQGELEKAVEENLAVLEISPNDYASQKNLAILYQQLGEIEKALQAAQRALSMAPPEEAEALRSFIAQLEAVQAGQAGNS